MIVEKQPQHCSFCGRHKSKVKFLIAAENGNHTICSDCATTAKALVSDKSDDRRVIDIRPNGAA